MKVLIIEDERPAAHKLIRLLEEADRQIEVIGLLGSIEQAINWLTDNPAPELIFMDIQLEDGISFEIFETCRIQTPVIFTTAYDEYAIRAFKVNSIDYLLKPIDKERLNEALEKFEKLVSKYYRDFGKQGDILQILQNITGPAKKYRTRFLISGEDKLFTLQVDDIAYFYTENKITFAVTHQNKEYIIDMSLDKLCEQLDPDRFFRTNRQTVVSVQSIQKIESYFLGKVVVKVIPPFKDKIIVSREKISTFKSWLNY